MARRRSSNGRRFLQLFTNVKRSTAYHGLGVYARAALFELIDRYYGCNNGMIGLGVRELAYELGCSKDSAAKALNELDDAKLAHPTKVGAWRGKKATEWRLTFLRCDLTGELPVRKWEQRKPLSQSATRDTKVREQGHRDIQRPAVRTQKRNSSMNGSAVSTAGGTHIDSHHRGGAETAPYRARNGTGKGDGTGTGQEVYPDLPDLPDFLRRVK
jgi:hypothetical protein